MAEKQRVYNVIRKTEYCPINETTVNVSTFSTRAAANMAMKDYTDKAQQQLKLMIKQKTGEEVELKVEAETDPKTGLTTGVTITLIMDDSTTPGIVDHWEVVPTIMDEDIEYHGEAQNRAKSAEELIDDFSDSKHGSFKLLKDTTAKLNGYTRPSSIKRTRKRQIEKARRMKHWWQETLTPIKGGVRLTTENRKG